MAQRQLTVNYAVEATRVDVDAITGAFFVTVERRASAGQPFCMPGTVLPVRLKIDAVSLQYLDAKGDPLWPVTPSVLTDPAGASLLAVKADMEAAIVAGTFDL